MRNALLLDILPKDFNRRPLAGSSEIARGPKFSFPQILRNVSGELLPKLSA